VSVPGRTYPYTVVVTNAGPSDAAGAAVTDVLSPQIKGTTWTCVGTGGATCTASGTGPLSDSASVPVGGTLTYTVSAKIDSLATGSAVYTAQVAAPAGALDPSSSNNTAVDTDTVEARGDFDGDGKSDILWQYTETQVDSVAVGDMAAWFLNGSTFKSATYLTPQRLSDDTWGLVGAGDVDGDGKPDLLWRRKTDGSLAVWYMNGTSATTGGPLNPPALGDLTWVVAAIADFNDDGRPDILWRNVSGTLAVWYFDGVNRTSAAYLTQAAPGNTTVLAGTGDFNRDGKMDILWQDVTTGAISIWLMDGVNRTADVPVATVGDLHWRIRGVGDYGGPKKQDLLWQNTADGTTVVWFMDGLTPTGFTTVTGAPAVTDPGWKVIAPR
jgi:uncharacterized repeat protein (TIGR01451 family)